MKTVYCFNSFETLRNTFEEGVGNKSILILENWNHITRYFSYSRTSFFRTTISLFWTLIFFFILLWSSIECSIFFCISLFSHSRIILFSSSFENSYFFTLSLHFFLIFISMWNWRYPFSSKYILPSFLSNKHSVIFSHLLFWWSPELF